MKLALSLLIGIKLALIISFIKCLNPAFQIALSEKGLNYLAQVTSEYFNQNVTGLKLHDIDGSVDIKVGIFTYTVTYSLYQISIKQFLTGSTSMNSSTNNGIAFFINDINAQIQCQFHVDGQFFVATTTATITLTNGDLQASALLGSTSDGKFNLSCTSCFVNPGSIHVDFENDSSWFFKIINKIANFADLVREKLQAICNLLKQVIDVDGNNKLKSFPTKQEIDHDAIIDYSQTRSPYYDKHGMATFHKGEFTPPSNPSIKYNFSANPLPFIRTNKMISFWLSEYIGNTAGITYQTEGSLNYLLSPETAENARLKEFLNTHSLQYIVPPFYQKYPDMNYTIMMTSIKPPHMTLLEGICCIKFIGTMKFSALTSNGSVSAFTVDAVINGNTTAKIESNLVLKLLLKNMNGNVTLKNSQIGPISSKDLDSLKEYFIDMVLAGTLTAIGKIGFQIPSIDGLTLANSSVKIYSGFIFIESDAIYYLLK